MPHRTPHFYLALLQLLQHPFRVNVQVVVLLVGLEGGVLAGLAFLVRFLAESEHLFFSEIAQLVLRLECLFFDEV